MSRNPYLDYAEAIARASAFEPWERAPRARGPRKPSLAGAMKQARKAGVTPVAATIMRAQYQPRKLIWHEKTSPKS